MWLHSELMVSEPRTSCRYAALTRTRRVSTVGRPALARDVRLSVSRRAARGLSWDVARLVSRPVHRIAAAGSSSSSSSQQVHVS